MAVVEGDPEHPVPQRLDDLALELDLLFFAGDRYAPTGVTFVASGPFWPSRTSNSTFWPSFRDL